jgi:hypothetical protein
MIKTNELRIGNLVSQNGFFGYVYSIESALPKQEQRFSDKDLVTLFDNGMTTVTIDEINPIPLTEKGLINFGFSELEKNYRTFFVNNKFKLEMSNGGNIYYNKIWIPYVHSLQNLYFALTGVELQLSSNVA